MARDTPQITRGEKVMLGNLIQPGQIGERRKETTTKSNINCKYKVNCNDKVLLYSTGNYIQYHMISHNRKEYEHVIYMFVYVLTCINMYICMFL